MVLNYLNNCSTYFFQPFATNLLAGNERKHEFETDPKTVQTNRSFERESYMRAKWVQPKGFLGEQSLQKIFIRFSLLGYKLLDLNILCLNITFKQTSPYRLCRASSNILSSQNPSKKTTHSTSVQRAAFQWPQWHNRPRQRPPGIKQSLS